MVKVIDTIQQKIKEGKPFFSFEFFPPKTDEGVENLFDRLERMAAYGPVFCDITWGAGGSTADITLDIATKMQTIVGVDTMMHLTCTNMPEEKLSSALSEIKRAGLQNVLALRGDPPKGQDKFEVVEGGFSCALDLVKYIRREFGDYFGLTVAGYPEAHPDSIVEDPVQMEKNYQADIQYLKQKVEAGADVIITQLFYDVDIFLKFVADCRAVGIQCPIVPGIMPVVSYGGFNRMTEFCKTRVPQEIRDALEAVKDNDEAVKAYGIDLGVAMCKRLLEAGVPGVHLYTLNQDRSALAILERLGLIGSKAPPRPLPWRHVATGTRRVTESVRPVFWHNRPKAYAHRTSAWESFPSGRWLANEAAAFAELPATHAAMRRHTASQGRREKALAAWGAEVASEQDVRDVFAAYHSGKISLLPWSELAPEGGPAGLLSDQLEALAQAGFLAVNSQPAVNGQRSDDHSVGWGGSGGFVYAKAYVEVFVSPDKWAELLPRLQAKPSLSYLAAQAATAPDALVTNLAPGAVNALTWGVFPGREIVQPTVMDARSFSVWKDEAFALWSSDWAALYEAGSPSEALLSSIASSYWLVAIADNDYIDGDLWTGGVFGEL